MQIPTVVLTVDCVAFDKEGRLLLIRRKYDPFQGSVALPGGIVDAGETTEEAARRELKEETGVDALSLSLIGVYDAPDRDTRGRYVSVAYRATLPEDATALAGDDAASAEFVAEWQQCEFAFDHRQIVEDAVRKEKSPDA